MTKIIFNPMAAHSTEDTQFMDHFRELPVNIQQLIIAVFFLFLLVALVILRDMIKTEEKAR